MSRARIRPPVRPPGRPPGCPPTATHPVERLVVRGPGRIGPAEVLLGASLLLLIGQLLLLGHLWSRSEPDWSRLRGQTLVDRGPP